MGFFFNDTATTAIHTYGHTLSLHDALPISRVICDNQFAVDHSFLDRKRRQRRCDRLAEAAGPVQPAARDELHLALGDVRLKPVTVELDLVEPFLARGKI